MNKKKYFALDAIRFSFRMFREHFYFNFNIFSFASLTLFAAISLISLTPLRPTTGKPLNIIAEVVHWISGQKEISVTEELEILKPNVFFIFFTVILIAMFLFYWRIMALKMGIMLYDKRSLSLKEIVSSSKKTIPYLGFSFVSRLATLIGSYFFTILGLFIDIRLKFGEYFIIDKDADTIDALQSSWNVSKKHIWDIFLLSITMTSILLVGSVGIKELCQYVGIDIVSIIITFYGLFTYIFINTCAYAFFFRKIFEENQMKLTPENVIDQDYNQLPKSAPEQLQP